MLVEARGCLRWWVRGGGFSISVTGNGSQSAPRVGGQEGTELFQGQNYTAAGARYSKALMHAAKMFDLSTEEKEEVDAVQLSLYLNLAQVSRLFGVGLPALLVTVRGMLYLWCVVVTIAGVMPVVDWCWRRGTEGWEAG